MYFQTKFDMNFLFCTLKYMYGTYIMTTYYASRVKKITRLKALGRFKLGCSFFSISKNKNT